MSELITTTIEVGGRRCRVWRKGRGPKLGFVAGFGGLPRWIPFLDALAETREVIVPSLPGFPGGEGHESLRDHLGWILATRDLLEAAGLEGCDLVASSVGAGLVAEVAAMWPRALRRLALVAPFGLFVSSTAQADPWAQLPNAYGTLLCEQPERWAELQARPDDADPVEHALTQTRAVEASARIYFPLGNTGLVERLPRISAPTLLVWGDRDRVLSLGYAERFAARIEAAKELRVIEGAGHLCELDRPDQTAQAILQWVRPGD